MTDLNALAERLERDADGLERLNRALTPGQTPRQVADLRQAAQALRGMGEALEPFALYCEQNDLDERHPDETIEVPIRDLLRARSALKGGGA